MKKSIRTAAVVCAVLSAAIASAPAAEKKPLDAKSMIGIKAIADVALDPSGRMAAFTVRAVDWDRNAFTMSVWLAWTDGSRCFPVTGGTAMSMSPAWTPDGRLTFLSTRDGAPQVFAFTPGYGEAEPLFRHEGGVQRFAWSPDGATLAFLASDSPDPAQAKLQGQGYDAVEVDTPAPPSRLFLFDARSRAVTPLVKDGGHIMGFSWSPDGSRLAFVTTPRNIEAVSWSEQTMNVVDRSGRVTALDFKYYGFLARHGAATWRPDGRMLALEVGALDRPELSLPIIQGYDFDSGKTVNLSRDLDHLMSNVAWPGDGRYLYYVAYEGQNRPLFRLEAATGRLEQLTHHKAIDISAFSLSRDGRSIAFAASSPDRPDDLFFGPLDRPDQARRITGINDDLLAGALICPTEEIAWTADDGLKIVGNIVYPAGYKPGTACKTITLIHGGPAGNFNNSFNGNYYCPAQYYAGLGYLVYLPNVRGSIGWGSEFMRKDVRDWGGGDYRDLMAGLDLLVRKGLADPDRLVVWGGSYGGYMTNWVVTQTDRFKAAHSEVCISDLASMWALSPIGRVLCRLYFGKTPLEDPEIYRRLSPLTYAAKVRTPLLMTQNEKDERVGPSPGQEMEFYRALEGNGVPVKLHVYPGEGHGTRKPVHQLDKIRKGTEWFDRFLKEVPAR